LPLDCWLPNHDVLSVSGVFYKGLRTRSTVPEERTGLVIAAAIMAIIYTEQMALAYVERRTAAQAVWAPVTAWVALPEDSIGNPCRLESLSFSAHRCGSARASFEKGFWKS